MGEVRGRKGRKIQYGFDPVRTDMQDHVFFFPFRNRGKAEDTEIDTTFNYPLFHPLRSSLYRSIRWIYSDDLLLGIRFNNATKRYLYLYILNLQLARRSGPGVASYRYERALRCKSMSCLTNQSSSFDSEKTKLMLLLFFFFLGDFSLLSCDGVGSKLSVHRSLNLDSDSIYRSSRSHFNVDYPVSRI